MTFLFCLGPGEDMVGEIMNWSLRSNSRGVLVMGMGSGCGLLVSEEVGVLGVVLHLLWSCGHRLLRGK